MSSLPEQSQFCEREKPVDLEGGEASRYARSATVIGDARGAFFESDGEHAEFLASGYRRRRGDA
jgi:hypothetical protein